MADTVSLTIEARAVMDALDALLKRGDNMQPVLEAIGMELENRVSARFESKTDPAEKKWAQWKPGTQKRYDKADTVKGKGGKPEVKRKGSLLEREGHMLGSLSHRADNNGMTIGFGMPYAIYHEFGTKRMKRRGMLLEEDRTLGAGDEQSILDVIHAHFSKPL